MPALGLCDDRASGRLQSLPMCKAPLLPDGNYVAATRAAGNPSFLTGTLYIKSSDQSVSEGSPLPGNTSVEIIDTKFLQNLCRWVFWRWGTGAGGVLYPQASVRP